MTKLVYVFALCAMSLSLHAADGTKMDPKAQEMMKKYQEYSTPGAAHKVLQDLAGEYTFTSKNWMSPEAQPQASTGTSTIKTIMGGRFIQQEVKMTMGDRPYEGMGTTGYNNVTKKYETTWMDNMSTGMMKGEAQYDAKTKTLKDVGQYTCPLTQTTRNYRTEWKILDKNNMIFSMYGPGMSGENKEFKEMEIVYQRKM